MKKQLNAALWFGLLVGSLVGCKSGSEYATSTLEIEAINEHVFIHKSYLQTEDFGKVGCNGLIYVNDGEAIVFDTPPDDSTSNELIAYIQERLDASVVAIVPTHFHGDCLGGLGAFHEKNIRSLANELTIKLATEFEEPIPNKGFENEYLVQVGGEQVVLKFPGEGHTRDNIIGIIPSEKAIFGGCLVKSVGAGKGFIGHANVDAWPETVQRIKADYPETQIVIPGHGKWGGRELLDYTSELFRKR